MLNLFVFPSHRFLAYCIRALLSSFYPAFLVNSICQPFSFCVCDHQLQLNCRTFVGLAGYYSFRTSLIHLLNLLILLDLPDHILAITQARRFPRGLLARSCHRTMESPR